MFIGCRGFENRPRFITVVLMLGGSCDDSFCLKNNCISSPFSRDEGTREARRGEEREREVLILRMLRT